eukprot:841652-Alexandrium_andersonii.AAC.1
MGGPPERFQPGQVAGSRGTVHQARLGKKPPWVFAHLAVHDNDGLARRTLQRDLSDYDAPPPALQQHHHRLTRRILRPDSSLRSELQQYLDG